MVVLHCSKWPWLKCELQEVVGVQVAAARSHQKQKMDPTGCCTRPRNAQRTRRNESQRVVTAHRVAAGCAIWALDVITFARPRGFGVAAPTAHKDRCCAMAGDGYIGGS